jgi:succinoglycan biosynthesis protein ExoO
VEQPAMSVSVIIPAYNASALLARALDSALAQTVAALEIIVVDDASTDDTYDLAKRYSDAHPTINVIQLAQNAGPSKARNTGIAAASGTWVAVLDADDAWRPQRIEVLAALGEAEGADYVADNLVLYDAVAQRDVRLGFEPIGRLETLDPEKLFLSEVQGVSTFGYGILKPFLRRDFLMECKILYREDNRYGEDFELTANILLQGGKAILTDQAFYVYTTRLGEISGQQSPHSQSNPRYDLLIEASDAIEQRYKTAENPSLQRAIRMRRGQLELIHQANLARGYRRAKAYGAYAAFVLARPALLAWLLRQTASKALHRIKPASP